MKKIGSVCEFINDRNRELVSAYFESIRRLKSTEEQCCFRAAASSPASRFWVSERRATEVINKMMRGESIAKMSGTKRKMFVELFRRVREYIDTHPGSSVPDATFAAVNSPAPEFYLTPGSARVIIYNSMRG